MGCDNRLRRAWASFFVVLFEIECVEQQLQFTTLSYVTGAVWFARQGHSPMSCFLLFAVRGDGRVISR